MPSKFQLKLWGWWREFWDEWVPEVTQGEPYDIVHNGDAIDGVHHNSTTQISHNLKDQTRLAKLVLEPVVKRCQAMGGTYYHIRGTEAHVGKSAKDEEDLAESLGAKPNAEGQHARYDLWKRVGKPSKRVHAPLVHLLHHIGTTSSAAHEASAVNAEMAGSFVEAGRWDRQPPDYIVRSHRHRSISISVPSARGRTFSIVTPAWQGKTPFAWKVAGARQTEPQIGGIVIRQGESQHYALEFVRSFDRSPEE